MATYASRVSEKAWLADLASLLSNAQVRFPDIVWKASSGELIYGHKMFVYSRAAGTFQHRYLGPALPDPSTSNLTLQIGYDSTQSLVRPSEENYLDPLQYLPPRPSSSASILTYDGSASRQLVPLPLVGTEPAFFQACLEFLYTGTQGMETVFSVLFDGFEGDDTDGKEGGIQRLRQDLLYAWRSKLFADVHLVLDDGTDNPTSFASHRPILASRSPYFQALLLGNFEDSKNQRFVLHPLFTPASTNFILGWIYSGTLEFSERTFDLTTALEIWRGAAYLSLVDLQAEVEIKIERMMNLKRAARILQFALAPDVNCGTLQRVASVMIKEHFGEIWNSPVIGNLEFHQQKALVEDVCARVSAGSLTGIAKDSFSLRKKLELESRDWAMHIGSMLDAIDDRIKECLGTCVAQVVISAGFIDLIDGVGFSTDALGWLLELIVAVAAEENAGLVYQALVGSVLLREQGILADAKLLCDTAKGAIMRYIKVRWLGIKAARGFDKLESWCLNEISDELKISVEELTAGSPKPNLVTSRSGLKVTAKRSTAADIASNRAIIATRAAARAASIGLRSSQSTVAPKVIARTPVPTARTPVSHAATRVGSTSRTTPIVNSPAQATPSRIAPNYSTPRIRLRSTASVVGDILREPITKPIARVDNSPTKPSRSLPSLPVNPPSTSSKPIITPRQPLATRNPTITRRTSSSSVKSTASTTSISVTATSRPALPKTVSSSRAPTLSTTSRASIKSPPPLPVEKRPASANSIRSSTVKRTASIASTRSTRQTSSTEIRVPIIPPLPTKGAIKSASTPIRTRVGSTTSIKQVVPIKSSFTKGKQKEIEEETPKKIRAITKSEPAPATLAKLALPLSSHPVVTLPGDKLLYGIACIVTITLNGKEIKFKARVKYLGCTFFSKTEELVGVEVYLNLLTEEYELDWNDGSVDQIQYFTLGEEESYNGGGSRSCTPLSMSSSVGLSAPIMRRGRRSKSSETEGEGISKGLFVKPSQIVYVL